MRNSDPDNFQIGIWIPWYSPW